MVQSIKDLKLLFSPNEREKIKVLIMKLMEVETILAYKGEVVPLDVFLNYTDIVGSLLRLYSNHACREKGVSYISIIARLKELEGFVKDLLINEDYDLKVAGEFLKEILQGFDSLLSGLTVGDLKQKV